MKQCMRIRPVVVTSLTLMIVVLMVSSCARQSAPSSLTTPTVATLPPTIAASMAAPPFRRDVCHVVGPLETVWRISKMYDVKADDIIRANNLASGEAINKGQRLLIPNAAPIVPVVPLYPSRKWHYIIIHHSATDYGSALEFDRFHSRKGWDGVGYHFVIDNGTEEKVNGQIEVSPRWIKQRDGAHCKANDMNIKGIGICVVGNFNENPLTSAQMESLVYLVKKLSDYYGVSRSHILGHGQVTGAATDCPGKDFPWGEFWRKFDAI